MPDLHSASTAYADEETVDTDFVHHLVRGAELLQGGDPSHARGILERALRLQPRNQRGQNLLALSYFKLGLFDRAEEIYRALITEHPQDPTLRVNLGLVHLKTNKADVAIAAFSSALELSPGHPKAQNYLGLAHLQKRDYQKARDWFEKAGNTAMAERATAQGAGAVPLANVGEGALQALDTREVPFTAPEINEATPVRAPGAWIATRPSTSPAESTAPLPVPPPAGPVELVAFSAAQRIDSLHAAPFAASASMVVVEVRAELFTRVENLVASFGTHELKPAFKRFRGRVTDKPFGEPGRRMMHASGQGRLWLAPQGRHFVALEIGDEPAYFREESLFAFEESLLFENGRVPSKLGGDLHLVHLRGHGAALLTSRHKPRSIDVVRGEPCRVPIDVLIGWHGNVAPRIVALAEEATSDGLALPAVELSGEGRVLLDVAI